MKSWRDGLFHLMIGNEERNGFRKSIQQMKGVMSWVRKVPKMVHLCPINAVPWRVAGGAEGSWAFTAG